MQQHIYIINVKYPDLTFQLKVLKHSSVKILDYEAIPPCKTQKAVNSFNVVTRNHQKNDMQVHCAVFPKQYHKYTAINSALSLLTLSFPQPFPCNLAHLSLTATLIKTGTGCRFLFPAGRQNTASTESDLLEHILGSSSD